jgi:hypothetical protein
MFDAALITVTVALFVFGPLLWRLTPAEERGWVGLLMLAALPMSWLMFHEVRMPLDDWLKLQIGDGSFLRWLRTAYAPLTEEPAKLWPLLIGWLRWKVTRDNVGRVAMALGLGFAVGEVFTVAGLIQEHQPKLAALPWYQLSGFMVERWMTCLVHSGLVAISLAVWRRGPGIFPGLLLAMMAHYLVNFPITMSQRGWLGSQMVVAQTIVGLWLVGCCFAAVALLVQLHRGPGKKLFSLGHMRCPGCGRVYERSLWGCFNFGGDRRYERCPWCNEWHWTRKER